MSKKTPEEIEELKKKYAADNAVKEAKKQDKKDKYKNENLPVVEIIVPWQHEHKGKVYEIDLERPPWNSLPEAYEHNWRTGYIVNNGRDPGPCKFKIIRT